MKLIDDSKDLGRNVWNSIAVAEKIAEITVTRVNEINHFFRQIYSRYLFFSSFYSFV